MLHCRGRHLLVSFTFYVVSNSVLVRSLCSTIWKNKNFQHFCRNAPRNGRSPVSELPHRGLQAFPVSVALLHRFFGPLCWGRIFRSLLKLVAVNDWQAIAPGFVDGLRKRFYASIQQVSFGKYQGQVPSCSHSSSCQHNRQPTCFSRFSFFYSFVERLA